MDRNISSTLFNLIFSEISIVVSYHLSRLLLYYQGDIGSTEEREAQRVLPQSRVALLADNIAILAKAHSHGSLSAAQDTKKHNLVERILAAYPAGSRGR